MNAFSLWQNRIWRIAAFRNPQRKLCLIVENFQTGFCDYPIKYKDGGVAWDYPERVPQYVKRVTKSILGGPRADQWARLLDCEGIV